MSLRYRPEIDGLRAIAVIPVILYHADKSLSSGGFVGVDVFFVISGYLITLLLLNDLASERFSILNFYERRARRILPALSAVMLACLPMAYFSLMPDAARDFSKSLVSVALFSSNFLFWYHSGYFDVASELKPLIHTWSLAVEEQYYLLFPLALLLMWRFARRWIFLLFALLAALSLAISQWGVWIHPSVAFYWLPMRGWELLIGAMVAFDEFKSQSWGKKEKFGSFGALIGLALIAIPMFLFTDKTPFPGVNALLPTAGAALVIYFATQKNLAGRILGSKPLVGIGLISYSAYLWHQPLLAFARNRSLHGVSRGETWILLGLSLGLSYLCWRFVEKPFRDRRRFTRTQIFQFAALSCAFFLLIGAIGIATQGVFWNSQRLTFVKSLENRVAINYGLSPDCVPSGADLPQCRTSDAPEVLLWGDSFAMHLMDGLLASNPQLKIQQAAASACGPVFDIAPVIAKYGMQWSRDCIVSNDKIRSLIHDSHSIRYVVLGSPFGYLSNDLPVITREGKIEGPAAAYDALVATLKEIRAAGKVPIVFSPTPIGDFNMGQCLARASYYGYNLHECDFTLRESNRQQQPIMDSLQRISRDTKVVWLSDAICTGDACQSSENGVFIFRDGVHLSREGSTLIGKQMNWASIIASQR